MNRLLIYTIVALVTGSAWAAPEDQKQPAAPTTAPSVTQQKLELARQAMKLAEQMRDHGISQQTLDDSARWSRRLMEAERNIAPSAEARTVAVNAHVTRMKKLEANSTAQFNAGTATQLDVLGATFYRLEAEELAAAAQ